MYYSRATVLDFDLEVLGLAFLQEKEEVFFLSASLPDRRYSKPETSLPILRMQEPLTKYALLILQQEKARKGSIVNQLEITALFQIQFMTFLLLV